mgnify:CR=1 FL=1
MFDLPPTYPSVDRSLVLANSTLTSQSSVRERLAEYETSLLVRVPTPASRIPWADINGALNDLRDEGLKESVVKNVLESLSTAVKFFNQGHHNAVSIECAPYSFAFDDDGELIVEWYGRKGARFAVQFGRDGYLYYSLLFHGDYSSGKAFVRAEWPPEIKSALVRLSKDAA